MYSGAKYPFQLSPHCGENLIVGERVCSTETMNVVTQETTKEAASAPHGTIKETSKETVFPLQNTSKDTIKEILLSAIRQNPNIKVEELADLVGLTVS